MPDTDAIHSAQVPRKRSRRVWKSFRNVQRTIPPSTRISINNPINRADVFDDFVNRRRPNRRIPANDRRGVGPRIRGQVRFCIFGRARNAHRVEKKKNHYIKSAMVTRIAVCVCLCTFSNQRERYFSRLIIPRNVRYVVVGNRINVSVRPSNE